MTDFHSLAHAIFQGCGANVGPLIDTELECSEVEIETTSEIPEGDLGVQPVTYQVDEEPIAGLTLSSPLNQIATLARRMLGAEEPDKEAELGKDELDVLGDVLNLMSGAIDQVIREQIQSSIRCRPLPWWRTPEPGQNAFEEGEFLLAKGAITVPGGVSVQLYLRVPPSLLEQTGATSQRVQGRVMLLDVDEELQASLGGALQSARIEVIPATPDSQEPQHEYKKPDVIILSGEDETAFQLCRQLRLDNDNWHIPSIVCMKEPTREKVMAAVQAGASSVLLVPTEPTTFLRVMKAARGLEGAS